MRAKVDIPVARVIPTKTRRRIVELYLSGLSTRAVAKESGVSKTTVLTTLSGAGVHMRATGKHY